MKIDEYESLDHIVHELKLINAEMNRLNSHKKGLHEQIKEALGMRKTSKDKEIVVYPEFKVPPMGRG